MSRLTSQTDMEYYPTDPGVPASVAKLLDYKGMPALVRMIDPCAGEGDALKTLEETMRFEHQRRMGKRMLKKTIATYGVELDTKRAVKARKKLGKVAQTDYFNMLISDGVFNVNFLNPPYDYDPLFKRLEQRFLVQTTRLLCNYGVLIYLVPRHVLNTSAEYLSQNYGDFRIWQEEGNPDAERFDQVILMARRLLRPYNESISKKAIERFARGETDFVGKRAQVFGIPKVEGDVDRFTPLRIDYADVLDEIERSGFETKQEWRDMQDPPNNVIKEPLMPTRVGHMGLIMSGGGVGGLGIPLNSDEADVIFRASSKKIIQSSNVNDEGTIKRLTERMSSMAVTLDPERWTFTDDVQLGPFVAQWKQELANYIAGVMPPKYTPEALRNLLGHAPSFRKLLRKPMPGNGQRLAVEGIMHSLLSGERGTTIVGEMGTGKTYISMAAAYLTGKRRIAVLCPPTLVWKWEDEILKTIPKARIYVVGKNPMGKKARQDFYKLHRNPMKQLRWLARKYQDQDLDVPVFIILAHSVVKASYGRIPAVHWRWGFRPQPSYSETTGDLIQPKWQPFGQNVQVEIDQGELQLEDDEPTDRTKIATQYMQRICCPECGQPIKNRKDEYTDWDWLTKGRRICVNQITVDRAEFKDEKGNSAYGTQTRDCGAILWQAHARNYISNVPGTSWARR